MDTQPMEYWKSFQRRSISQVHDCMLETSPEISSTPSLSGSPEQFDFDSVSPRTIYHESFGSGLNTEEMNFSYQLPITPTDYDPTEDSMYCNSTTDLAKLPYLPMPNTINSTSVTPSRLAGPEPRTHATSGRRRAQNRAAQRAFRERKEKHARDLEEALAALTEKHRNLETSHAELSTAYNKLKMVIELLTKNDEQDGFDSPKPGLSKLTLRKLVDMIQGDTLMRVASAGG